MMKREATRDQEEQLAISNLYNLIIQKDYDSAREFLNNETSSMKRRALQYQNEGDDKNALMEALLMDTPQDLMKLLIDASDKEILQIKDKWGKTALYHECRNKYDHTASPEVVKLLIEKGGRELLELHVFGHQWTVLHVAINNLCPFEVVELLVKEGGITLVKEKERNNANALYLLRGSNKSLCEITKLLLDVGGLELITNENKAGQTPMEYWLSRNIQVDAIEILLKRWIELDPEAPKSPVFNKVFLLMLERPYPDQKVLFETEFIKKFMNESIVKRKTMVVLMMNMYVQTTIVGLLSFAPDIKSCSVNNTGIMIGLSLCLAWLILRETIQMMTTSLQRYVLHHENYIDLAQIWLLSALVLSLLASQNNSTEQEDCSSYHRNILVGATFFGWAKALAVLGNFFYGISVLVAAISKIFYKLIPFVVTTCVLVLAFAHMYDNSVGFDHDDVCKEGTHAVFDYEYQWMCKLSYIYFKMFTNLLKQDFETFLEEPGFTTRSLFIISIFFACWVGVLLFTILIAVITDVFAEVQEDGQREFWLNRLDFITQTERMLFIFTTTTSERRKHTIKKNPTQEDDSSKNYFFNNNYARIGFSKVHDVTQDHKFVTKNERDFFLWLFHLKGDYDLPPCPPMPSRLYYFFKRAKWNEIMFPGNEFEKIILGIKANDDLRRDKVYYLVHVFIIYPCFMVVAISSLMCFILGALTFGLTWPTSMKHFLFHHQTIDKKRELAAARDDIISLVSETVESEIEVVDKRLNEVEKKVDAIHEKLDQILTEIQKKP